MGAAIDEINSNSQDDSPMKRCPSCRQSNKRKCKTHETTNNEATSDNEDHTFSGSDTTDNDSQSCEGSDLMEVTNDEVY